MNLIQNMLTLSMWTVSLVALLDIFIFWFIRAEKRPWTGRLISFGVSLLVLYEIVLHWHLFMVTTLYFLVVGVLCICLVIAFFYYSCI